MSYEGNASGFVDNSFSYDGDTPENHPLGGSHSSLVYLTRALATLGHDVHVFNNCPSPGIFHGVHYHRFEEINSANNFLSADGFIALRDPAFFRFWLSAGKRILWVHDAFDQPILKPFKKNDEVRQNIDCIFCVSGWQAWTFLNHFHWPADKIFVTHDAICLEYFPKEFSEPTGHRLVYASTPFQGLELLLKLYPKIYRSVPYSKLHVFSSMKVYQQSEEEDQKQHGSIYSLANQPGVIMHGSIGQNLASELTGCRLFAYPNIFPETGCISTMEALAAGCPVVTSRLGALPETIGPGGILISGIPGTDEYNEAFVESCVRLLTDNELWYKTAKAGREWVLGLFTWDKVARQWTDQIHKLLQRTLETVNNLEGWHSDRTEGNSLPWEQIS